MDKFVYKWITVLILFLYSNINYASYRCVDIFKPLNWVSDYTVAAPVWRAIDAGKFTETEVSELFANRMSDPIPELIEGTYNRFWFISETNQGIRYKVVLAQKSEQHSELIFVRRSTNAMERYFFRQLGRSLAERVVKLEVPLQGFREIRISGSVQIKMYEKHGLRVRQVVEAIQSYEGKIIANNDPRLAQKVSFGVETKLPSNGTPLRIFVVVEGQQLVLLTAFIPNH